MAALKKVTVVGAAGNLGQCILRELIASQYDVTVMSRIGSTSTFEGVAEQNVIRGEYTPEFFRKALLGQDALVLAIGSGALDAQKAIIEAAAEVGVRRILPSEFGGTPRRAKDISNPTSLNAIPFNHGKKTIADHLEKVVATHPKTTWTAVVSGPFFDWCLEYDLFGCNIKNRRATLYDQGTTRFDCTNIGTVGKAVARILSMPDKFQNERILISGMAVTQLEILEALKHAIGFKDWDVSYLTAESLRQEGNERMAKNDFNGVLDIIGASLFQAGNGSYYSATGNLVSEQLGVKDDLYQTVKKYVHSL
ncbi:hypothetical protein MMC17_008277 [Xylographa soralifera]|nr:hypothetical protein [Xylographa soralifera]